MPDLDIVADKLFSRGKWPFKRARFQTETLPKFEFVAVSIKELSALAKRIFEFDEKVWRSLEEILQPFRDKHPGWFSVGRIE